MTFSPKNIALVQVLVHMRQRTYESGRRRWNACFLHGAIPSFAMWLVLLSPCQSADKAQTHTWTATFTPQPFWEGCLPLPPLHSAYYSALLLQITTIAQCHPKKKMCRCKWNKYYISSHSLLQLKFLLKCFFLPISNAFV